MPRFAFFVFSYLKTFSIIFDIIKSCDERLYINAVLASGGLDPFFILGDNIGPLTEIEKMLWHKDQPLIPGNLFLHWAMMKEAHNQDVRILLDGVGGDQTVSHGLAYIAELARKGRLCRMLSEVKGLARNLSSSPKRVFFKYAIYPLIPEFGHQMYRVLRGREDSFLADFNIVNSEFIERIGLVNRKKALQRVQSEFTSTAKEDHYLDLIWGFHQLWFEECNMASSAFSVEIRCPFYDKRLMEFCLAIPSDQKIRNGWTRWIMRSALKDVLPEEIYYRGGKADLSRNFSHGLMTYNKAILEETMLSEKSILNNYVNSFTLGESYRRFLLSQEPLAENEILKIWNVITLSLWIRDMHL